MSNRRSLAEALEMTPQAIAFIKKGPPKIEEPELAVPLVPAEPQPSDSNEPVIPAQSEPTVQTASEDDKKTRTKKERGGQAKFAEPPLLTTAVVSITTRFRQATAEALRRASLERKLERQTPYSQQEIVELAVSKWLKDNGYSA